MDPKRVKPAAHPGRRIAEALGGIAGTYLGLCIALANAMKPAAATPAALERIQKPATPVDMSRLSHPGLPADLASPSIEHCAKALSRTEFGAAGAVVLDASVSPEGLLSGLSIRGEPMKMQGLDKPLPSAFLSCIREALSRASIHREPNARATSLVGRYVVLLRKWPADIVVSGRTREKSP